MLKDLHHFAPPADRRNGAGLVVIQEWWGVVEHMRDVARRFAALGYEVALPDLYHGKATLEAAEAQHLMEGLDWPAATAQLAEAARWLRAEKGCKKVGATGFCMGGALTVLAGTTGTVDAAVAFYGFPPGLDAGTKCPPTKLWFGEDEGFFSVPDAQAWAAAQRALGVAGTEVHVYPGAGHAFFNDTRPEAYHRPSAEDAWRRTTEFFAAQLA